MKISCSHSLRLLNCALAIFFVSSCSKPGTAPGASRQSFQERLDAIPRMMDEASAGDAPALVITDTKIVTPSPLEVFKGYDLKVNLTVECQGTAPTWWGTLMSSEEKERGTVLVDGQPVAHRSLWTGDRPQRKEVITYDREINVTIKKHKPTGKYETAYLIKLAGLKGRITLQDDMPFYWNEKPIPKAAIKVDVPLADSVQVIKSPAVSKTPCARLGQISVKKDEENPDYINVSLIYTPVQKGKTRGAKVEIFDSKGRNCNIKPLFDFSSLRLTNDDSEECSFNLNLSGIPRSAGKLTARGYLFSGDMWPVTFSIPFRDQAGRVLVAAPTNLPLQVVETEAVAEGSDLIMGIVTVRRKGPGKNLKDVSWTGDPSPVLVDSSKNISETGALNASFGTSGTGRTDEYILSWGIDRKELPLTRRGLSLKMWFAADGGQQIPVSIPLDHLRSAQ